MLGGVGDAWRGRKMVVGAGWIEGRVGAPGYGNEGRLRVCMYV